MSRKIVTLVFFIVFLSAIGARALRPTPSLSDPSMPITGVSYPAAEPAEKPVPEETTFTDEAGRVIVVNTDSILVLVNKQRNLPADYVPGDLVRVQVPFPFTGDKPRMYLREEAAAALAELFAESASAGLDLYATSGYRSYETQKSIFYANAARIGEAEANKTSAHPGQSEHQTGLAMDVTSPTVNYRLLESFGETGEGKWLSENAHIFGYIIRYPEGKEHITGYSYEPWHVRYVGKKVAELMYSREITLEEYILNSD